MPAQLHVSHPRPRAAFLCLGFSFRRQLPQQALHKPIRIRTCEPRCLFAPRSFDLQQAVLKHIGAVDRTAIKLSPDLVPDSHLHARILIEAPPGVHHRETRLLAP
jgi:hypothetical protein